MCRVPWLIETAWVALQYKHVAEIFKHSANFFKHSAKLFKPSTELLIFKDKDDLFNKHVFAHFNINSIRNKFGLLSEQIKCNVDVLTISETKIDDIIPVGQFFIEGFCIQYSLDCNSKGESVLLYVREDIPLNLITVDISPIESFYVELNLRNNKWLINCSYNPHKSLIGNHLDAVSQTLDLHSTVK